MTLRLAAQEHLLDGDTLVEKYEFARSVGFDGVELLGRGDGEFARRADEIAEARRAGVVLVGATVVMDHFIADWSDDLRRDAREQLKLMLTGVAAAGGVGVVTPNAFGQFSRHLPPFTPPRPDDESRAILVEAVAELGDHAASEGVSILLEPLNRFEDFMVNRLADAVSIIEEAGSAGAGVCADTFHMSIEESDVGAAIRAAGAHIRHVQLGDSNRLEPGAGHYDWAETIEALADIGYDGWVTMECGLSGPPAEVLPKVSALFAHGGRKSS
ncbi:sugar phosphate isomerase/epimerase [Agromyces protaetiae]|uniref:Sugar phosphate isomerase/epimerase n=1 Tax=Agromyces protaetiae TaxID=2509455 RepID=A0A4P6FF66_9MICO|nr:sugar phosphate isomerase/epimerase family protein [Agromyces protaetiae]QAY72387.1 sugar phosphate isomerase/epimerase [Agromyces protaetiae]